MRPAFSSTNQAAAIALLLLALLGLPAILGKNHLPPREQAYAVLSWDSGPYPWIQDQIFEETNAIDIAFVGSSHMANGIDTPYVQRQLEQKNGPKTVVRSLTWGGSGYDGLYLITKDLLQHRKVKLLVFYDEKVDLGEQLRNGALTSLFRFREDFPALAGLPIRDQASYYMVSLIGAPKTLLSLIRPGLSARILPGQPGYLAPQNAGFADAPVDLGAIYDPKGFTADYFNPHHASFVAYQPPAASTGDALVYSASVKPSFAFSRAPLPPWHLQFAKRFAQLAQLYGCHLVLLNIPVYDQRRSPVILERAFWPDLMGANLAMLGVVPAKLFAGLPDEEVQKLFKDPVHFNRNGQQYFTQLITPALLRLYEASATN